MISSILIFSATIVPLVFHFSPEPHPVPRGTSITLDGVVDTTEWKDAAIVKLPGNQLMRWKHDGRELLVALTGNAPFLPSLCIARNDTVRVLHASASVGDAIYSGPAGGPRQRTSDFAWALRDGRPNAQPEREQQQQLESKGWVASTAGSNAGAREYRIRLALIGTSPQLAVAFVSLFGDSVKWPLTANDDCARSDFAMGSAPATARFTTESWVTLAFSP